MNLTKRILLLLVCNCLCFNSILFAQNKFTADLYNAELGLPSNHIEACTMDSTGFLWVATKRGICRYDGYNFQSYPTVSGNILSLFNVGNKKFVYYTNTGGLAEFDPYHKLKGTIASTQFKDSDPSNDHYNNIFVDDAGRIWCCDFSHIKFYNGKPRKFKSFALINYDSPTDRLATFTQFRKGQIWVASLFGLYTWNEQTNKLSVSKDTLLSKLNCSTSARIGSDSLLIAAKGNLILVQPSSQTILSKTNIGFNDAVISITTTLISGKKCILIASRDKVYTLSMSSGQLTEIFTVGPNGGMINSLFCSGQDDFIWISSTQGLIKLTPSSNAVKNIMVTPLLSRPGENAVTQVIKYRTGYFVNTSIGECYFTYLDGYWEKLPIPSHVNHIALADDKLIAGTSNGLFTYNGSYVSKVGSLSAIQNLFIKKVLVTEKHIWLLTKNKPLVLDKTSYSIASDLLIRDSPIFIQENLWKDIHSDVAGTVYLAGWMRSGYGLAVYDKKAQTFIPISARTKEQGLFIGDYYNRIADSKNFHLLFSGYGGFNTVNEKGIVTQMISADHYNLANDHVEGIAEMPNGSIWFGTEEGIQVWSPKTNQLTLVTSLNGLPSNNVTYGFDVLNDNTIAIGSNKVISLLNTDKILTSSLKNKLVLSSLQVNGENRKIVANQIAINPNERNLQMSFSTLNFCNAGKIEYQYSINGGKWLTLGHSPVLVFSNFKPGDYAIKVRVSDNQDQWQPKQLQFNLVALPAFHETIWFIIVVIFIIVIIIWLLFSFRLRQLKKLSAFRSSVSQDLHDDVGATLSSINILSAMLAEQTKLPEKSSLYLQRINTDVQQLQLKLDEIIWSLKKEDNSLHQIFTKLVNYGYAILDAKNIVFEHRIDGVQKDYFLPYKINRNLYLLVKEALNNIAKHSTATRASFTISLDKNRISIIVTDNGKGIAEDKTYKRNGISGMKERASEIGAVMSISTVENKGTEIRVQKKM
ncbi:sensor histidine kinase [Pedobacter foliorum]|uniref:sensor histidine kinase n=1 Tax=Pedobacter foliorum TaxID=2739058 RepID=UPI0015667B85|nr:sensor histidine kinase [Pedobacter foliorum]NRF40097.1 hypothetical protein [Pedobacter foliorum]